jgi:hypothetical protein
MIQPSQDAELTPEAGQSSLGFLAYHHGRGDPQSGSEHQWFDQARFATSFLTDNYLLSILTNLLKIIRNQDHPNITFYCGRPCGQ